VSSDNLAFVARASAAGLGVAVLPIPMAARFVGEGVLEHILPAYRFTGGVFAVVLPSSTFVPSRVALLRDFLVDHLTKALAASQARCPEKKPKGERPLRADQSSKGKPARRRTH
jgi:DNA-binding transcriptional LysR family regulator